MPSFVMLAPLPPSATSTNFADRRHLVLFIHVFREVFAFLVRLIEVCFFSNLTKRKWVTATFGIPTRGDTARDRDPGELKFRSFITF